MKQVAKICTLVLLAFVRFSGAANKTYATGDLTSVEPIRMPLNILPSIPVDTSVVIGYQFTITDGDNIYVGFCRTERCKLEWQTNDKVQYRAAKYQIYLKRSNGKEFRLSFVVAEKKNANGTMNVIRRGKELD